MERVAQLELKLRLGWLAAGDLGLQTGDSGGQIAFMHDLGDGGVKLVPIAIRDDFAPIFPLGAVAFGHRGEGVRRGPALDAVIGNDGVNHVFRAALGHVAIDAIGCDGGMGGGGEFGRLVAAGAGLVIAIETGLAVADVVGVMAGAALQFALALEETLGLAQAVNGADDFKFVLAAAAGGVIEGELEGAERLTGAVGERSAIVAADGVGQETDGGFQMALGADIHFAILGEAGGIDDGGADGGGLRIGLLDGAEVVATGAMAALAIDALGELSVEHGFDAGGRVGGVGVVAEHTVGADFAPGGRVRCIEARVEGPGAAGLGIPGEGEFSEGAAGGAVEVGADVVAGAHDEIDLGFTGTFAVPFGADLPPALEPGSIAGGDFVPGAGGGVEVGLGIGNAGGRGDGEGLRHAAFGVAAGDGGVARGTGARVDIVVRRHGCGGLAMGARG